MDKSMRSIGTQALPWWARGILVVLLASLVVLQASAQEDRCSELGPSCFCSEPLNVSAADQGPIGDLDGNGGSDVNYNPPDSTTKECHPSGASVRFLNGGKGTMVSAANVGLPPGHSVTSVFEMVARMGGAVRSDTSNTDVVVDLTDKTYCARSYFREDPGMPSAPGGEDDIKGVELGSDSNGINFDEDGGYSCFTPHKTTGFTHSSTWFASTGDTLAIDDCAEAGWCSLEICQDHNWDGTDRLRVRCRLRSLGTGKEQNWTSTSTNSLPTAQIVGRHLLFRMHTDLASGADIGKLRRASHIMTALFPSADPNTWIGPAVEIEGGSSGSPAPPAAPVLLP